MRLVKNSLSWSMYPDIQAYSLYVKSPQPKNQSQVEFNEAEQAKLGNHLLNPGTQLRVASIWYSYNWAAGDTVIIAVQIEDSRFRDIRADATAMFFPHVYTWNNSRNIKLADQINLDRFTSCM